MFQLFVKLLKRFAIFIPGIIVAYVSWEYIIPFFNKRLPYLLAILLAYGVAAYILLPAIIRGWHILLPPRHLPLYCVTPDGFASDPLNIAIIGLREEVIEAMEKAGWHQSEPTNFKTVVHQLYSMLFNREYLNSPLSHLYLFGRKQDIGFSKPVVKNNLNRHHVRLWAATYDNDKLLSPTSIHWYNQKADISNSGILWIGSVSLDLGLVPMRHNWQLTHMVDPDTNKERELLVRQLKKFANAQEVTSIKLGDPYSLINRAWRGILKTDGIMKVIRLK